MRGVIKRVAVGAALAGGLGLAWSWSAAGGQPQVLPPPENVKPAGPTWMGVATCTSVACHHGGGGQGAPRSEYSTWAGHDKHAQAYNVLFQDRSVRMIRNLYGDKAPPAHETPLCLKCHATNEGNLDNVGERFHLADGVGCESCHGAADRYLTRHYQAGFKELSVEEKWRDYGLAKTKDIGHRAKLCSDCHVGNAARGMEVNHDLIAAGHPRLNFELGGYLGVYPKHWQMGDERRRYPDFQARAWTLGQIESARAALELLHDRASHADTKPWPEFAEYDCFACHRDLTVDSAQQKLGYGKRKVGSLPWGGWYYSHLEQYAAEAGVKLDGLAELRAEMEKPAPNAKKVAELAAPLVKTLGDWLAKETGAPTREAGQVQALMAAMARKAATDKVALASWDDAAQSYLVLGAMHQALGDLGGQPPAGVKADLLELGTRLRAVFPKGYDSPRGFDPLQGKPSLLDLFESVHKQLGK